MKHDFTTTGKMALTAAVTVSLATAPVLTPAALAADTPLATPDMPADSPSTSSNPPANSGSSESNKPSVPSGNTQTNYGSVDEEYTPSNTTTGYGNVTEESAPSSGGSSSASSNASYNYPSYTSATDTGGYYTGASYYDPSWESDSSKYSTTTTTNTNTNNSAKPKSTNWSRLGGADRYETMSQIVTKGWSSSSWAVLAVGTAFPDALTASSLAGARDCPVLLTDGGTLSPQAKSQIQRLGVKDVYVVGGEGAVSAAVANQVSELGVTIHRIAGQDRVSTSIEALKEARAAGSTSDVIIVATGDAFADALSIGSWSYLSKSPILLARGGSLSEAALSAIRSDSHVKRIVIVGGEAAVSDSVKTQLGDGYEYERLAGSNRYETSTAIANWTLSHNLTTTNALVATGANFPDALAGAALGGKLRSVLLLEDGSGSAARWLTGKGASVTGGSVLGGTAAVSDSAMAALK